MKHECIVNVDPESQTLLMVQISWFHMLQEFQKASGSSATGRDLRDQMTMHRRETTILERIDNVTQQGHLMSKDERNPYSSRR